MFAGVRQLLELGETIHERLDNPLVEQVVVGGPPIVDERKIFVKLHKQATDQQIVQAYEHTRDIIRELDPEHDWEVHAFVNDRENERAYPPKESPPANQENER